LIDEGLHSWYILHAYRASLDGPCRSLIEGESDRLLVTKPGAFTAVNAQGRAHKRLSASPSFFRALLAYQRVADEAFWWTQGAPSVRLSDTCALFGLACARGEPPVGGSQTPGGYADSVPYEAPARLDGGIRVGHGAATDEMVGFFESWAAELHTDAVGGVGLFGSVCATQQATGQRTRHRNLSPSIS
ncbi:MAG: hypothetical protein LBJ08_03240, partial [Bifidobacteriaceae bacterium]|nr:hypothetical protein [Bifidobacteriaceae bacterium]